MRALIEQRLAQLSGPHDPSVPILANVVGQVSAELRAAIAQSNRQAAVLIGLLERPSGLHVLLTERAQHLRHHPGQVSFPGGMLEATDADPVAGALREAHEEVGLAPEAVSVAGCLQAHATGTGFCVTPVVGFIAAAFEPKADPTEVSDVFEVPLQFVLDAANLRVTYRDRLGSRFRVYEIEFDGHLIWGATAAMLMTLKDIIYA